MEGKIVIDLLPHPNYDEGLFANGLKDLRNVKEQLYSAADHFEDSYYKNDQKQMLFESLKNYISKSLIKTIDHLGSVMYKLNNFLDHNVNEASRLNLQLLCIEQRLQTCQAYANKVGLYQYLETPQTPKCPKKYTLPGGFLFFKNFSCILLRFFLIIATENCVFEGKAESFGVRKGYSGQFPPGSVDFSFRKAALNKRIEKRSRSISPIRFRIKRSESASCAHRSMSPNISRRSCSSYPQRESPKDMEAYSKKTRNLFKLLLNMYKSKNKA
ncbi:protein ABIL2 isoform X2 [Lactuca sativa]|uniref:protein ABIL2 isoform X2 n=1 Tax=Lactuca sativa TaxID=4236 RepID=UPI000CD7ED7F|nr:protein ABIL2 isoform X2 [Lactuca sativa]